MRSYLALAIGILGAASVTSAAYAQTDYGIAARVTAPTVDYSGLIAAGAAYRNAQAAQAQAEAYRQQQAQQAQQAEAQAVAAQYRQHIFQAVGAAMADGKCDEAKGLALRAGEIDLAARVPQLCKPATPPPSQASSAGPPS